MSLNPVVPLHARVPEWTPAERLRKGRREARLTQARISELLGVKESTYAAWESGRNTPDILLLAPKLEEITGVSRMFFIGWVEGTTPPSGGPVTGRYQFPRNIRTSDRSVITLATAGQSRPVAA